ncbi:MAG: RCC1 domain-containing protein, partial [Solirubrobacterales bacterium]
PWTVPPAKGALSISGDLGNMCVVLPTEQVKCWGSIGEGALGDGGNEPSVGKSWDQVSTVIGVSHASAVATSQGHSCAIAAQGQVKCWGNNRSGQLGVGESQFDMVPSQTIGISNATSVAAGIAHSCVTLTDSSIRCWGNNGNGNLGVPESDEDPDLRRTAVEADPSNPATAIAAGYAGTCATGTAVRCWGGDLFTGPSTIDDTSGATETSVGTHHVCALFDGDVGCWGENWDDQLGDDSVENAVDVSAGSEFSCAVLDDGTAKCWGRHPFLGDGVAGDTSTAAPVVVSGLTLATQISSGHARTCALRQGGDVVCWGDGSFGVLGNGTTDTLAATPVSVTGLTDAVAVSVGGSHTCAVRETGSIACWGYNHLGQLGDGSTATASTPVAVTGISNATAVAAGAGHTCALLETGVVTCWGDGRYGQTGIPFPNFYATAVTVLGLGAPYVEPDPVLPPRPVRKPDVKLSKAKLGKSLTFEVTCFAACTVSASLKPAKKTMKLGSKRLGALRTHKVKFKITKKIARAVAKARKRGKRISLTVKATNLSGETRSQTTRLK